MLFRLLFQEYTVEGFSTETLSSCESKDGPITIYFSLKGEILKVLLFAVFLLFVGENACSVSSLCKGFVVEQMDWERYIKNRKRKLSQEGTKHSNLERENKMLWPSPATNCVFFRNSIIDNIDIRIKVFHSKSL